jgi:Subtilase family
VILVRVFFFVFLGLAVLPFPRASAQVPANLGLGLRNLAETYEQDRAQFHRKIASSKKIQSDTAGRIIVNIHLDGTRPVRAVALELESLGGEILAIDTHWRDGVISARLPIAQAIAVAKNSGVQSVMLAPAPIHRAGSVTAESSIVEHVQQANRPGSLTSAGLLGRNISIGIVSDSFNSATGVPRATAGVASGDLPGAGNPDGYTQPVVVLEDNFDPTANNTDEGRGMAEIIHDLAPAAKICFHQSGSTEAIMSIGIRKLRADQAALCDVIVDDVFFFDEPFFSDGEVAQAVEDVVRGNTLPGKKVSYFSAAGNSANFGYSSDLRRLTSAQGIAAAGNLDFTRVPRALYAGGFHNLNPIGPVAIAMPIKTDDTFPPVIAFQWDDPFDAKAVTTDYNLLVFDESGNYIGALSGIDNNKATDEPIELIELDPATNYQLVISIATTAPPVAKHLRFICVNDASLSGKYIAYNATSMGGHATAANANATAAYVYNTVPQTNPSYNPKKTNPPPGPYKPAIEDFTSNGGRLAFYFNAAGKRLPVPEFRFKPEFAAADGVDTTFFPPGDGQDYDNDRFPNFFGTSAAAPSAAAIAGLLLEAAGGPESLSPATVRSIMEQTTFAHDLDPNFSKASAAAGSATVQVAATGNSSNDSATNRNFFTVSFNGKTGERLNRLVIDLRNTLLVFDDDADTGFPFTVGSNPQHVVIVETRSTDKRTLTLDFAATFQPGDRIAFGIDRDFLATHAGGNSADLLAGANIRATIDTVKSAVGAFANHIGHGFTFADGFGLVDAQRAVESIVGARSTSTAVPLNVSTRGNVGTGDAVLIGGFIIQGNAAKQIVLRALGPSLTAKKVMGVLSDPMVELHNANGNRIAFNNDWRNSSVQASQIQSRGLAPASSRESALTVTLQPGNYTAIVRGRNNTQGIALVEVYDLDAQPAASMLVNISTRGDVGTGDNAMIGGFIIADGAAADIVIRALGPSLAASHVSGVLMDPTLELHDGQGRLIARNDNWQQDSDQAVQIASAGLAPSNALECGLATTLRPGNYSAIVRGANGSTGIGLVEVYKVRKQ